ncbi:MAG: hypothetical protein ACREJI_10505, partial [Candidatus Methylomirabilales bacterium]
MSRRFLVLMMVPVAVLVAVQPASAEVSEPQEYVEVVVRPDLAYGNRSLVTERVVTAAGEVRNRRSFVQEHSPVKAFGEGLQPCAHHGTRAGFAAEKRVDLAYRTKNDFAEFQFYPFRAAQARVDDASNKATQQWLICGTGGGDANNGSRTMMVGPGVAFPNAQKTYKIGQQWRTGQTPANYSIGLGFEVARDPVSVSVGFSQTPTDTLQGSSRPPYPADVDAVARNGVNAWWE